METYQLIRRANAGDEAALSELVSGNVGLVWSIVRRFLGRGVESDDLYQLGCIGLIKAVRKFDESYGVQFSTYAVPMIMGEIKRFLRDDGIIKVSRSLKELATKARAARESLMNQLNREPTVNEIAETVGVSAEDVAMALDALTAPETLSAGDDDGRGLLDRVASTDDIENDTINKVLLRDMLATFKARERQVIMLRYYGNKSQTEIARMLGISQVQVSRIEKKVIETMRAMVNY